MINGEAAADRIYFIIGSFDLKGVSLCECPFNVFVEGKKYAPGNPKEYYKNVYCSQIILALIVTYFFCLSERC